MRAHEFGLNFCVSGCVRVCVCACMCVHNHISDLSGPILFVLDTKTTRDGMVYVCTSCFFRHLIQDGRLAAIFVEKKKPGVKHILNHFSDMHLPMLLKLGTQIKNDGLHMHIIFFRDHFQDGRLVPIFLLKCVPNHFSSVHGPILFKLGTSTDHDGIHMPLTIFCDLIKDGHLVDWRPF